MKIGYHFSNIPYLLQSLKEDQFPVLLIGLDYSSYISKNADDVPVKYITGYALTRDEWFWKDYTHFFDKERGLTRI